LTDITVSSALLPGTRWVVAGWRWIVFLALSSFTFVSQRYFPNPMKLSPRLFVPLLLACAAPVLFSAEKPQFPDWAWPGSATHQQVPPPKDFHRATVTTEKRIGVFSGQSDIGGPLIPGSSSYDRKAKSYTLNSASYNIWYTRDEFRYVWKKLSGDVSLAADITFPVAEGYDDRKAVLVFRQDLDDDAKEAMVALHGGGLIHLAFRPEKNADIKEAWRMRTGPAKPGETPIRLGIEKHGDTFALFVSLKGEPMHQVGTTAELHLDAPFYVGLGFCSHVPDTTDTAVLSRVVLENSAGSVR
jgi:hypothetical protein